MKLFAIRHLQTDWNLIGRLQGSNDRSILPPSPELLQHISTQKELLDQKVDSWDYVLVSPLKRTHQTAQLYGYTDYLVEELIREIDFSSYEGQDKQLMSQELGSNWLNDPYQTKLGTEVRAMEERIKDFVSKYASSKILIFSHGAFIRGLLSYHAQRNLQIMNTFRVENNQLIELEF